MTEGVVQRVFGMASRQLEHDRSLNINQKIKINKLLLDIEKQLIGEIRNLRVYDVNKQELIGSE